MQNFDYQNPTKLLFGKGKIAEISKEIPANARVLMTYGGGSIKKNGVYEQVRQALHGVELLEFGGIEANPRYETLLKAVEIVKKENIDFLLSVGGGSTLDGTKFIAAASRFHGEPWDILSKQAEVSDAVALGCVLTLSATGSEMNPFAVISRHQTGEKLAFSSPKVFPKFSVLDPTTTFSLPPRQIANGVVDAFTHVMEQYLTFPSDAPLQDRFAESILQTLVEEGPKTLAQPTNYEARANLMLCATLALNGLIACGVPQDWATHTIGHEITALHGLDHAQTLAVVLPGVMRNRSTGKSAKLLQYATRIWGITAGTDRDRIEAAIRKTEEFFESLGVKTRLSSYGIKDDTPGIVARRLEERGAQSLGERGDITPAIVREILATRI